MGKLTTAPALVEGTIDTINAKRNESINALQMKMESTTQWLDDAINSAKRKIAEGADISIQDVKKAKTTTFADGTSFKQKETNLSPIRSSDKENSPNVNDVDAEYQHVRIKPPASAVKRKVDGMRVVDLRKELKQKGKETKGLKKDLQERLLQAYTTVEKIMSPQKTDEEREDPPTEKAEDNIPDSESVEVIVFESSTNKNKESAGDEKASQEMEDDEKKEASPKDGDVKMKEEISSSSEFKTSLQSAASKESLNDDKKIIENMEMEPLNDGKLGSNDDVASKEQAANEEKRLSMMDCTPADEESMPSSTKKQSMPEETQSSQPEDNVSRSKESSEEVKIAKESKNSTNSFGGIGRKVSQESINSSSEVSNSSKTSESKEGFASGNNEEKEQPNVELVSQESDRMDTDKEEKTSTSPIKRVQAAIQLFTSKSPAKPKSAPTPSKLAWLNKSKFQKFKTNNSTEELEKAKTGATDSSVEKQEDKPEPMTTGKAILRPGMGLYNHKATSSALKTSSKFTTGHPNSALSSASAKATNEARRAKLAEMRGKSKPVSKPGYTTKQTTPSIDIASTISSLKSAASAVASGDKDTKRKLLTAQMREKAAAARKQQNATTAFAPSSLTKSFSSTLQTSFVKTAQTASTAESAQTSAVKKSPAKPIVAATATIASIPEKANDKTANNSDNNETKKALPMDKGQEKTPAKEVSEPEEAAKPPALSPLDTYEISDREESESESETESEDEDEKNARKKIPEWAHRANLIPSLEKQFAQGPDRVDPDEIFPEVQTCDLQAIFSSKRSRYIRRTSSANWSRDKVTPCEQLAYKRAMGYPSKKT